MNGYVLDAIKGSYSTCDNTFTVASPGHKALENLRAFKLSITSSATTDGTSLYVQMNGTTSVTMYISSFETYMSNGFADLRLIKISTSSTHTAGSNQLLPYNKNNGSTVASYATFYNDPSDVNSTASGNYVADRFQIGSLGSGLPTQSIGSAISQSEDAFIIMNSTYIIQIDINTTAATCWFTGRLSYYEHNGD